MWNKVEAFVTDEVEGDEESVGFYGLRGADQVQEKCLSSHRIVREPPERSSQAIPWWSKRDLSIQRPLEESRAAICTVTFDHELARVLQTACEVPNAASKK